MNNMLQMIQMLSNSNNPMALLQQFAGSNPDLQKVMQIAQTKNPQEFQTYVKNVCASNNIDINSLAKQFNLPL